MIKSIGYFFKWLVTHLDTVVQDKYWAEARPVGRKEKPLCDVTCFRGPDGVYSVSQDGNLWVVELSTKDWERSFPHGSSSIRTRHPRDPGDKRKGTFFSRTNAMHAARKWAGVVSEPTHPVPNRRAAIAHSRSKT